MATLELQLSQNSTLACFISGAQGAGDQKLLSHNPAASSGCTCKTFGGETRRPSLEIISSFVQLIITHISYYRYIEFERKTINKLIDLWFLSIASSHLDIDLSISVHTLIARSPFFVSWILILPSFWARYSTKHYKFGQCYLKILMREHKDLEIWMSNCDSKLQAEQTKWRPNVHFSPVTSNFILKLRKVSAISFSKNSVLFSKIILIYPFLTLSPAQALKDTSIVKCMISITHEVYIVKHTVICSKLLASVWQRRNWVFWDHLPCWSPLTEVVRHTYIIQLHYP